MEHVGPGFLDPSLSGAGNLTAQSIQALGVVQNGKNTARVSLCRRRIQIEGCAPTEFVCIVFLIWKVTRSVW